MGLTTRELIEAVMEADKYWPAGYVPSVPASDYKALRAATLAVLDGVIAKCDFCPGTGAVIEAVDDDDMDIYAPCPFCANARALRERLR